MLSIFDNGFIGQFLPISSNVLQSKQGII